MRTSEDCCLTTPPAGSKVSQPLTAETTNAPSREGEGGYDAVFSSVSELRTSGADSPPNPHGQQHSTPPRSRPHCRSTMSKDSGYARRGCAWIRPPLCVLSGKLHIPIVSRSETASLSAAEWCTTSCMRSFCLSLDGRLHGIEIGPKELRTDDMDPIP